MADYDQTARPGCNSQVPHLHEGRGNDLIFQMNRKNAIFLFMIFFLAALFGHYSEWRQPDQSLFLAQIDDPAPRFSFYPWLIESSRQFRSGHFPLWCASEGAGFPLMANYQSAVFSPFNLAFTVFPSLKFLDYLVLLKIILLGFFTFIFAMEIGLSPLAAAGAAVIICFSGYVSKNINQINLNTEVWLPACLILAERVYKNRADLTGILLLGLVTGLALLGGNPEASLYFVLFVLLYLAIRGGWRKRKQSLAIILGMGFGFILASAQLLSFIEYLGYGWHIHDQSLHTIARPPLKWVFSLFYPWLFGPNRTFPEQLFVMGYLGLVPILLSFFSFFSTTGSKRHLYFFWIYALVFLAVIYSIPPFYILADLPVLNRIASVKFAYFGVCFSISILAGLGLDAYYKSRIKPRRFALSLVFISGLAIVCLLVAYRLPFESARMIFRNAWLLPMLLLVIAAAVGIYGNFFGEQKLCAGLLLFLALINLLHLAPGLGPEGKIDPLRWQFENPEPTPILLPIMADRQLPRFAGIDLVFHQNLNLIFGISDLRVFEGIYPESYVRAMAEIEGFSMDDAVEQFFKHGWSFDVKEQNLSHQLINQLGVKYSISGRELNVRGWEKIMNGEGYFLYENKNAWPRAWLKLPDRTDFSSARIVGYQNDQVKLEVGAGTSAELVIADQYAPGWKAKTMPSGEELKILPESGLFRKIPVNPGMKEMVLFYQPWGFRIGLWLSAVGLLCFVIGLIAGVITSNRQAAAGPS